MTKLIFALHERELSDVLRSTALRDRLRSAGAVRLQVNVDDTDVAGAPLRFGTGTPITAVVSVWSEEPVEPVVASYAVWTRLRTVGASRNADRSSRLPSPTGCAPTRWPPSRS